MSARAPAAALLCFLSSAAGASVDGPAIHEAATRHQVGAPAEVPPGGVVWSRDVATWRLVNGSVRRFAPMPGGGSFGFVFEGSGRFTMDVPDAFERDQLRRFASDPALTRVDVPFSRLIVRTCAALPSGLPAAGDGSTGASPITDDRVQEWLRFGHQDLDARLVAAALTPGDTYLIAEAETPDWGWIAFVFDPFEQEEARLVKVRRQNEFTEVWVSLDRAEERAPDGRPSSPHRFPIDVSFVDLDIDARTLKGSALKLEDPVREWIKVRAEIAFTPQVEGARALDLELDPWAVVDSVSGPDGSPIPFARERVGGRFAAVDNDLSDSSLLLFLDPPLARGKLRRLTVHYRLKVYNFAEGRSWYPGPRDGFFDPHTAKLTFHLPKKYSVRAVGRSEEESTAEDGAISTWVVARPTKMLGFCIGRDFVEEKLVADGAPTVLSFGHETGFTSGNMVHNVGADVANSLAFFSRYFGVTLPNERLVATRVLGYQGQAFDGLLYLSQYTYDEEHPGASELFRAHEAAHEFWGHLVGWKSYRDQWLSEAFAEYSAMLFVQASHPKARLFEEIVEAYSNEQTGSVRSMNSKFGRPWNVFLRADERRLVGPISAGWRASAALVPQGYELQVYDKGALVLHMVHSILRVAVRDRDVLREVFHELLTTYSGKEISTDDFRHVLEAQTHSDWSSFFAAWVDGTAIPKFRWHATVGNAASGGGRFPVRLEVETLGVPEGFTTPVPVGFEFSGDKHATLLVQAAAGKRSIDLELPAKPIRVEFNPGRAILGETDRY
jgi:hypothetical protein